MRVTVQVIMNKFSCAKEVYKIAIIRWRIDKGSVQLGASVSAVGALAFLINRVCVLST